jgi:hypothetical protein
MIPLLLFIYIGIEFIEYKFGNSIREKVQKAGNSGPAVGALAGSLPQCGFSVIAAALYTQRLVTIGTLLAVYISTSDEAIPVILSQPKRISIIFPLILTKIGIAIVAGYLLDYVFRKSNKKTLDHIKAYTSGSDNINHHHETVLEEKACCGHQPNPKARNFNPRQLFVHPLIHTAKIFLFIFSATLIINYLIFTIGQENLARIFLGKSIFQPILASLFGLIPNCAASVVITELYLKGTISYGSVIAGLSSSGGLGLLVLFRENSDKRDTFKILGLLIGISIIVGIAIQLFNK